MLVTGGAGFIGTNFIRFVLDSGASGAREDLTIVNLDKLTYAGNPLNLADVESRFPEAYHFVHGDICDRDLLVSLFEQYQFDAVVHFAAESHVDRSVLGPKEFVDTNVIGTFTLLEAARASWGSRENVVFHHVSTDEVYGSLGPTGFFTEETAYDPRSPYSATKAASDHLVRAYHHTYGLPITITNCSNNYGPYQFPEKLIPLMILNILDGKPLPVYGDGSNVRDWLYVEDHSRAVSSVLTGAESGKSYNVGGGNEWTNIKLVRELCNVVSRALDQDSQKALDLITYVTDRPGHDQRYAIDASRIKDDLGWEPGVSFAQGLEMTVDWYLANTEWVSQVRSGGYREWIEENYGKR